MPDREHRVREIAHRLWEQEGRPSDQDKRHWATAEQILDAQERTDATMARDQAKAKRAPARRAGKRTAAKPHAGATTAH
jgi:hypothetical protein